MFHKCKLTVIKRMSNTDLTETYAAKPEHFLICDQVEDNQEFIVTNPFQMPENICATAWADIRPYIIAIASGSKFGFMKDQDSVVATCTDPFRPVIFLIERMD